MCFEVYLVGHAPGRGEWFAIPDAELPKLMEAMNAADESKKIAAMEAMA